MTTVKIPEEYLSYDYGFSGTDDPSLAPPPPREVVPEVGDKLDEILARLNNLSGGTATEAELREKIRSLEQIIVPLLNNLLKTADKPYIHWPDRAAVVEAQLKKVLSITRG